VKHCTPDELIVYCDFIFIRVKILDDDVDFKSLLPVNISNTLDDDIGDDNPAVAEFVDERPQHVKELEMFRQSKQWKLVTQPHGTYAVQSLLVTILVQCHNCCHFESVECVFHLHILILLLERI